MAQWWQLLVCCLWTLSDSRWWQAAGPPSCTGPCPSWSGDGDRDQSWRSLINLRDYNQMHSWCSTDGNVSFKKTLYYPCQFGKILCNFNIHKKSTQNLNVLKAKIVRFIFPCFNRTKTKAIFHIIAQFSEFLNTRKERNLNFFPEWNILILKEEIKFKLGCFLLHTEVATLFREWNRKWYKVPLSRSYLFYV